MQKEQQTTASLLKLSDISLTLERYEDIFSTFDSRPYSERALSDDFIQEAQRASIDKHDIGLELNLLIPQKKRKESNELIIKERLKAHFRKHYHQIMNEKKEEVALGIRMIAIGVVFMFIATYMLFTFQQKNLFVSFIIVLLEPAGWFTFWEGLNQVIFEAKKKDHYLIFYRKMANAEIRFKGY